MVQAVQHPALLPRMLEVRHDPERHCSILGSRLGVDGVQSARKAKQFGAPRTVATGMLESWQTAGDNRV
jgi:hypothetical protein